MTTELKVLKQILKDNKKASVQLIARQLVMENDYIRYLCKELLKRALVKKLERRDWYEITQKGRQRLEAVEELIIKEPVSEKHIPPQNKGKKKIKKKAREEQKLKKETPSADSTSSTSSDRGGSPQAGSPRVRARGTHPSESRTGQAQEKARGKITKKLKRKAKKKDRKKVLKIQKEKIKTSLKLRSRKKKIIKNKKERKAIPLEKQSKEIIKVFKNLFRTKKS